MIEVENVSKSEIYFEELDHNFLTLTGDRWEAKIKLVILWANHHSQFLIIEQGSIEEK